MLCITLDPLPFPPFLVHITLPSSFRQNSVKMLHIYLLLLVCRVPVGFGVAHQSAHYRMHNPAIEPFGRWNKLPDSLSGSTMIELDFALAATAFSLEAAVQQLWDASDPSSARFGRFWTGEQVAQHFAPPRDSIHLVARWLEESGISQSELRISVDRAHLYFNATVRQTQQLLGTKCYEYSDGKDSVEVVSGRYFLPEEISNVVDVVLLSRPGRNRQGGTLHHPLTRASDDAPASERRQSAVVEVDCLRYMSPDCVRRIYNMPAPPTHVLAHPNNSFGIYQTAWATWIPEDLDKFFAAFQPALIGNRPVIQAVNGGYRQSDTQSYVFNLEANLDFEYAMSLAYPVPVTNIQVGDKFLMGNTNIMLAAYDAGYCETALDPNYDPIYPDIDNAGEPGAYNASDCGRFKPPLVISISYAWNEAWFSDEYAHRQCLQFLKLGLQGSTVIAASGDFGTADQRRGCLSPGNRALNASEGHFSSNFPASCPWVTAVGGTQWQTQTSKAEGGGEQENSSSKPDLRFPPETAFHGQKSGVDVGSGGGFSNVFSVPFYQVEAVNQYLSHPAHQKHLANLSSTGYFNSSGRGWPDLSVMAANYLITMKGAFNAVTGTSASTPVFGSMIALINDSRLKAGKGPVGFLNPLLYAHHDKIVKSDVETDSNAGCGIPKAFPASKGWDAVTGLGTPDFGRLMDLYMSLP
jgi:tripeptidyl-peptidase I